jgi:uncharacterized protein (DUF885 family)
MPESVLADEIDRYIAVPGQALTYLIGKREMLRLRTEAHDHLQTGFAPPGFHAALLDGGALPIPVLEDKIRRWAGADRPSAPHSGGIGRPCRRRNESLSQYPR